MIRQNANIYTLADYTEVFKDAIDINTFSLKGLSDITISELFDQFADYTIVSLSDKEKREYKLNPKKLSNRIYGDIEFWFLILLANNIKTVNEFTLESDTINVPSNTMINKLVSMMNYSSQ